MAKSGEFEYDLVLGRVGTTATVAVLLAMSILFGLYLMSQTWPAELDIETTVKECNGLAY